MPEPDLSQALSIAAPHKAPPALRRGACPSLDEPMQTGDGLLARLRIPNGSLTPRQLRAIAIAAAQYGNGQLEITARGNLQIRGLTPQTTQNFAGAIRAITAIERGLVVETPPLAGMDPLERADPRPLAQAIRALPIAGLGPKVTVVVDGNGQIDLNALGADIRLTAVNTDHWHLTVGANPIGILATADAVEAARAILSLLAHRGETARGRDLAPDTIRAALNVSSITALPPSAASSTIGDFTLNAAFATGIALPFGSIASASLIALAQAADHLGITELRLAPHHTLLAFSSDQSTLKTWRSEAARLGFITIPNDPRRAISACIGSDGCASGHIAARALAAQLAQRHPALFDGSVTLHVSGCAKGCAHPRAASLTLVGTPSNCALVSNGLAGDTPLVEIAPARVESAFARLVQQRRPGETSAGCLTRLGASTIAGLFRQE